MVAASACSTNAGAPASLALTEATPTPETTPSPAAPSTPEDEADAVAVGSADQQAAPEDEAPRWRTASAALSELRGADAALLAEPVALAGRILADGSPIAGATVQTQGRDTTTAADGTFRLNGLERRNSVVDITAPGHLQLRRPIGFAVGPAQTAVDIGDVQLLASADDRQRLVFGGDVALGRRYLDPSGATPRNEVPAPDPEALINTDTPYRDTVEALRSVEQMLEPHDFASVNLESVVTTQPARPWEERTHVMFSLPESVRALADAGVDHVSLGNNHIWDYNQAGVIDTLSSLDGIGLAHSGAGLNSRDAFQPHIWSPTAPDATSVALHSFVSIEGVKGPNLTSARSDRGGGADLNDGPTLRDAIVATEADGHITAALTHTGYEYTEQPPPDDFTVRKMRSLVDLGADLVVGHHPHIPQGFEYHDDTLIAYSLGNLAFDQLRLDTTHGALLTTTFDGDSLADARVVPVFIDDYVPQWAVGSSVDLLLRRLSWLSGDGVVLAAEPAGTGARVVRESEVEATTRTVEVHLSPDADGTAYLDLRQIRRPHESLAAVVGVGDSEMSWGRDLMMFGDMEDADADDVHGETPFWSYGTSTVPCSTEALRGTGALCAVRHAANSGPASVSFTRRIRVVGDRINEPNKDLTLVVHAAGDNRGELWVEATFRPSQGSLDFGTRLLAELPGGTDDYHSYWVTIPMPPDDPATLAATANHPYDPLPGFENARAVRVAFRHQPPDKGVGVAMLDDVAVVSWEDPTERTPNPFDFVRIRNATPGQVVSFDLVTYD